MLMLISVKLNSVKNFSPSSRIVLPVSLKVGETGGQQALSA